MSLNRKLFGKFDFLQCRRWCYPPTILCEYFLSSKTVPLWSCWSFEILFYIMNIGVPQGCVLGPLLIHMKINDLLLINWSPGTVWKSLESLAILLEGKEKRKIRKRKWERDIFIYREIHRMCERESGDEVVDKHK